MEIFTHNSIFEVFALDLEMPPVQIKEQLINKGTESFLKQLKEANSVINTVDLVLFSPLFDSQGTLLLNNNIVLNKFMNKILDRHIKDESFCTGYIHIKCTAEMMKAYKDKTLKKLVKLLTSKIYNDVDFQILFQRTKGVKTAFQESVFCMLSSPKGMAALQKIIAQYPVKEDIVRKSIFSSLIYAGVNELNKFRATEKDMQIGQKGVLACLIKDYDNIVDETGSAEKVACSLFKNDANISETMNMYKNHKKKPQPMFAGGSDIFEEYCVGTVITISTFLDMLGRDLKNPVKVELHKYLSVLADDGYADKKTAELLSKLFLPEFKVMLMNKAIEIRNKCSNKSSHVWKISGDMLPTKIICNNEKCPHNGSHKTYIPKDVYLGKEAGINAKIDAGIYYSCERYTRELQDYYKRVLESNEGNA